MILGVLPAVALLAGCMSSNDEQSPIAGDDDGPPVQATATNTATPATPRVTSTPRHTPTPRPTPTPTPIPPRISVAQPGFVHYTNSLGDPIGAWWVDVTNESSDRVALVRVQGIFYNSADITLGTDTIYIDAIFPGQTLRAVDSYVSLSGVPARIETRIERQDFTVAQTTSVLTVEDLEYVPDASVRASGESSVPTPRICRTWNWVASRATLTVLSSRSVPDASTCYQEGRRLLANAAWIAGSTSRASIL